jgi:outer membrane protein assembly factor BamB
VRADEVVECLDAETGASKWRFTYGTEFEDRYGHNNGPRASPVIDGTRVFTMGAEGKLHCLDVASGTVIWKRDLRAD